MAHLCALEFRDDRRTLPTTQNAFQVDMTYSAQGDGCLVTVTWSMVGSTTEIMLTEVRVCSIFGLKRFAAADELTKYRSVEHTLLSQSFRR